MDLTHLAHNSMVLKTKHWTIVLQAHIWSQYLLHNSKQLLNCLMTTNYFMKTCLSS